jgi:hypothetical protein
MRTNKTKEIQAKGAYTTRNAPAPENGDEIVATTDARLARNKFASKYSRSTQGRGLIGLSVRPWEGLKASWRHNRSQEGSNAVELTPEGLWRGRALMRTSTRKMSGW